MFDNGQLPLVSLDRALHAEEHSGPYQPGWRRSWFRRHRPRVTDDEHPGQPRIFAP